MDSGPTRDRSGGKLGAAFRQVHIEKLELEYLMGMSNIMRREVKYKRKGGM